MVQNIDLVFKLSRSQSNFWDVLKKQVQFNPQRLHLSTSAANVLMPDTKAHLQRSWRIQASIVFRDAGDLHNDKHVVLMLWLIIVSQLKHVQMLFLLRHTPVNSHTQTDTNICLKCSLHSYVFTV